MARRLDVNECRQCATYCDRVIDPGTCAAAGCPALYFYDDPGSGRRYMGCLYKVFAAEIDVQALHEAQRTSGGFGAVKLAGAPLPWCRFSVEQAHPGEGDAHACRNRRFFDWPVTGEHAIHAFDLRDRL